MKETKSFFTKNNRLNKGYAKSFHSNEIDKNFYRKKFEHILPPIDTVTEYENIYPGTLEKLVNMAQKEQAHKHEIELQNLKIKEKVAKLTRICLTIFGIVAVLVFGICLIISFPFF
ncbi:hypothetical protein BA173_02030 [Rickettsia sp. MEAM1 (Bemisia tabaci)]|uniref:DUF2335 domain-containing protein n=1 Tax=unclassified Rickettsia TaxID=114295 RepID=UPI0002F45231|nr:MULTISPECIES: DUF2335 domain-containing protein [unclassified Rickettsia]MCC8371014.1 DUF2335 domain-containing protein [Rickettsia endosymbiont of Stiretrus anchorago]MCC8377727.1 DUF2335 domain-containing protein [Rickettsia endosymbiont of Graphium doson]HJD64609.1 DUF2335 domain-containing protein [Rickettsia endosymbiont of Diachasma alloeum]HJD65545.1 DUF2335 domain-containing protein [Rickettsia endosymbiont of Bembidion nr. Transversale]ASX27677.1 hypothetical protein BA173_02030 [R